MVGVKRTALGAGRTDHRHRDPPPRRLAGLRQGRRAQRDGDRGRRCVSRDRPRGPNGRHRARIGRTDRHPVRRRPRQWVAGAARLGRRPVDDELAREFGRRVAGEARPIDDHRSTADVPPPRRRRPRRPPAAAGVRIMTIEGIPMNEALRAARQRERGTTIADAWIGESLLYVLRERLGLIGTKGACEQGECGSCSRARRRRAGVRLSGARRVGRRQDDRHRRGHLARRRRRPTCSRPSSTAGAVQCGFCTPGLIVATHALLDADPEPTELGGPRGAVRQHLPLHRLRPDHRRRRARSPSSRRSVRVDEHRRRPSTEPASDRAASATAPLRPDGIAKVQGTFTFSSDLTADGCLWGATLRSPHPYARIVRIDVSAAWKIAGVEAIITAADVPGKLTYGLISRTSRCSPATSCATSASRSPRSPPIIPRPAAGRSTPSSSPTRCSNR